MKHTTLHRRIRSDITERIRSGKWPLGHRVPSERELMVEYDCSRMTVNKALVALAEHGLIVRRKKAGSFVARPRIHSPVLDIPDIGAEVTARGEAYKYELLSRALRKASPGDAAALGLLSPSRVLALRCLHRADGRPFALEERLINTNAVPEAVDADFSESPPGPWLLGRVAWTQAEHRISATNPNRLIARTLKVEPTTACLVVERRTWRERDRITYVRLVFPGEAYDLVAHFAPQAQ